MRVLGTLTVANQRTLEQKISDAGPFNQRIDPHVLSDVPRRLMSEGRIGRVQAANAPWFFAGNTAPELRDARLQDLLAVYNPYLKLANRIGQALEIATYRAFCRMPEDTEFYGRFKDLDEHDNSTMYSKEEPPQHIGTRSLHGDETSISFCARLTPGLSGSSARTCGTGCILMLRRSKRRCASVWH